MKINDQNALVGGASAQTTKADQVRGLGHGDKNAGIKSTSSSSDVMDLSGLASRISSALESSDTSRAERVNRLAQMVQSGSYQIDTQAISSKMIDDALSASGSGQ